MDHPQILPPALDLVAAAFDGSALTAPLAAISAALGAEECLLFFAGKASAMLDLQSLRAAPDTLAQYLHLGMGQNPREAVWRSARFNVALDFDALVPEAAFGNARLRELMRRTGFPSRHVCGIRLRPAPGVEGRLGIGRNDQRGRFPPATLAALETLAPYLEVALKARLMLGAVSPAADLPCRPDDLDTLPKPLALFDAQGRFVLANEALRAITARGDGLSLGPARLMADDRVADAAIVALIEVRNPAEARRLITARRPERRLPYLIKASVLAETPPAGRGGLMLVVTDPDAAVAPSPTLLRSLLGVTQAEACLAIALAAGARLDDHARARGISHETARTQLKAVMAKSGCRRQADLVTLLARLARAAAP